jgi:hypothetical protein
VTTYSFRDVTATIFGPGGVFSLGADSGVASEGISIEYIEDKDTMNIGADGAVMHSLHAGQAANVIIRLQKTSPVNAMLSIMYDLQIASSTLWGINTITVTNPARGDISTCLECAFRRFPSNTYATEGNTMEWAFNSGKTYGSLGAGS